MSGVTKNKTFHFVKNKKPLKYNFFKKTKSVKTHYRRRMPENYIEFLLLFMRRRRKREYKCSMRPGFFRHILDRFVARPIRFWKRKKRHKPFYLLRKLSYDKGLGRYFKRMKLLKRVFFAYYVRLNKNVFRRLTLFYRLFSDLTKFERFLYFFESRLPALIVRIKFVKTFYQAVRFLILGGVRVNGYVILYVNFLPKTSDLLEIAFRFYQYNFSKRYVKYKQYFRSIRKRGHRRHFYRSYLKKKFYFRRRRLFQLSFSNRFFEKSRRIAAAVLVTIPNKIKYRRFTRYLTLRTMHVLSGLGNNY